MSPNPVSWIISLLTVCSILTSQPSANIILLKQLFCTSTIHNIPQYCINAIGPQKVSCLYLLDLSAAFDTTDHDILITRLSSWSGIHGSVLSWFKSYLSSCCFRVKCETDLSSWYTSSCGVLQGSVLGPLLFVMYTTPLSTLISSCSINHHLYASLPFLPSDSLWLQHTSSSECSKSNLSWTTANLLTWTPLRPKTEFLLTGLSKQLAKIHNSSVNITHSAQNLGFIFDEHLTFSDQISSVSKSCYYHIHKLLLKTLASYSMNTSPFLTRSHLSPNLAITIFISFVVSVHTSIPKQLPHRHFHCSLQAWLLQLSLSQPAQVSDHPAPTDPELLHVLLPKLPNPVTSVPSFGLRMVKDNRAHWIQAPFTYLQSSHNHLTFISA